MGKTAVVVTENPAPILTQDALTLAESDANLIPLEVIRTENVISKFPVHNLAKTGRVNMDEGSSGRQGCREYWLQDGKPWVLIPGVGSGC